jgi:hypothetical protein
MYVVAQHKISDPAAFWSQSRQAVDSLPSSLKLCQTYPNADGTRAVCLWQADSVEAVKEFVDSRVGNMSTNEYYEVGSDKAMGLPE